MNVINPHPEAVGMASVQPGIGSFAQPTAASHESSVHRFPSSQSSQATQDVAPSTPENVPGGHGSQGSNPSLLKKPGEQGPANEILATKTPKSPALVSVNGPKLAVPS